MTFALTTHWNTFRHKSGEAIIEEILALGFDRVELGYDLTLDLVPGVRAMVEQKAVSVASVHNFCPVPIGAPAGHPELFPLAALDDRLRQSAVAHTRRTIEFAADIGAPVVVTHAGNVDMGAHSRDLVDLCAQGQQYSPAYDKLKLKITLQREGKAAPYLDRLSKSIEELLPVLSLHRVRLAIENLPSWESIPTELEMERLLAAFDSPALAYWHDTGHGKTRENLGFISQKRWLERLAPRLAGMHVHDNNPPASDHIMPPDGKINFADFKGILKPDTLLVLEPAPGTPHADIIRGATLLGNAWGIPFSKGSPPTP